TPSFQLPPTPRPLPSFPHDALPIYTKLPEEQQREIRMPALEGRADNAVREATGSATGGITPFLQQEAKKQLDAAMRVGSGAVTRSEEHTSELQSRENLVCRLLLEKK